MRKSNCRWTPSVFATAPVDGVSNRYSFLPTDRAIDSLRSAGWFPVEASQQPVRNADRAGYQAHMIRFQRKCDLGSDKPQIVMLNSHDRSRAYQLHVGVFRFVCSNGLIVGDALFDKISIRHTDTSIDEIIEASMTIGDQIPVLMDRLGAMKDRILTPDERLAFAAKAIAIKWEKAEKTPISPDRLLTSRRAADRQHDLYTTMNVVQENLIRGGCYSNKLNPETGCRFPRTRQIRSIDQIVSTNKSLWDLASTFSLN